MLKIGETLTITSSFEKAMESHKQRLAERWEKDREMELKQIEENLKGITELVSKLYEEVENMKQGEVEEEPKKYQLNVYVDKPKCYEKDLGEMHHEEFWYVNNMGEPIRTYWENCNLDKCLWENTTLFKDRLSAETYLELMHDMKRLSKFEFGERNYYLSYVKEIDKVTKLNGYYTQMRDYCFTEENAQYIIDKYGQEVLKNFILYCK